MSEPRWVAIAHDPEGRVPDGVVNPDDTWVVADRIKGTFSPFSMSWSDACHAAGLMNEGGHMEEIKVTTIDITPSWQGIVRVLIELATNGATAQAKLDARHELFRMAVAADKYNEMVRSHREAVTPPTDER